QLARLRVLARLPRVVLDETVRVDAPARLRGIVTGAPARLSVEVDERYETARLTADDREREREAEPSRACAGLGLTAHSDPCGRRILNRTREHRQVLDGRTVRATPGDAFTFPDPEKKPELFLKEFVVVSEVVAEQGKRFGERAAARHDLGTPVGDEVERREVLKDPDRIVGADDADRARETYPLRASGRGGEDHGWRRHDELAAVMLAQTVDVEADLVRELDLLEKPPDALVGADRSTGLGIGRRLGKAVAPEFHLFSKR